MIENEDENLNNFYSEGASILSKVYLKQKKLLDLGSVEGKLFVYEIALEHLKYWREFRFVDFSKLIEEIESNIKNNQQNNLCLKGIRIKPKKVRSKSEEKDFLEEPNLKKIRKF